MQHNSSTNNINCASSLAQFQFRLTGPTHPLPLPTAAVNAPVAPQPVAMAPRPPPPRPQPSPHVLPQQPIWITTQQAGTANHTPVTWMMQPSTPTDILQVPTMLYTFHVTRKRLGLYHFQKCAFVRLTIFLFQCCRNISSSFYTTVCNVFNI